MSSIEDIVSKSVVINVLGEEYNFLITLFGIRYLAEVYGTAKKADALLVEQLNAMQEALKNEPKMAIRELSEEFFDVILHYLCAGLEHNKYNRKGDIVRELPTFMELKLAFSPEDIFLSVLPTLQKIKQISFKAANKGSQEENENP